MGSLEVWTKSQNGSHFGNGLFNSYVNSCPQGLGKGHLTLQARCLQFGQWYFSRKGISYGPLAVNIHSKWRRGTPAWWRWSKWEINQQHPYIHYSSVGSMNVLKGAGKDSMGKVTPNWALKNKLRLQQAETYKESFLLVLFITDNKHYRYDTWNSGISNSSWGSS